MSVAAKVEIYVSKRPYMKEALAEGIVNHSALGRKICGEKDIESLEAVKAALSRYEEHLAGSRSQRRNKVIEVLEETRIKTESGLKAVKADKYNDKAVLSAKTENGFTNILHDGEKAVITMESPEKLEKTPGVIEYILSSLSAEGINIDQLISCREDTHLVVDQEDLSETLELVHERF